MERNDMVNHPNHYKSNKGIEVIDVIEAFTEDLSGVEAVSTGNVLKYMCRWKKKNGLEDLKKAQWYLTHLIDYVEDREEEEVDFEFDFDITIKKCDNTFTCPSCGNEPTILNGVHFKEDGTITAIYPTCNKCGYNLAEALSK